MPQGFVQGTEEAGFIGEVDPVLLAALTDDMAPLRPAGAVGSRAEVLLELAGVKAAIRTWHSKQPDQVLREASAYSARLTELWTDLRVLEANDRQYTQLRTMQVDPVLQEIDRQYRFASSRIALQRQDIDLLRGT
jgi:hypothetical protein